MRLVLAGAQGPPTDPFVTPRRVDVNRAGIAELASLPGLGRKRAAAVVLHRVRHGPFARIEDLAEVDGVGPGTVEAVRPFLIDVASAAGERRDLRPEEPGK